MKNLLSLVSCLFICLVMLQYRGYYSDVRQGNPPLKITEWDAFGYYIYLPAIFIYHDYKELKWLPEIDKKYGVTGGNGIQALKADNGNYAFKYLGGVAILEIPFFFIGHEIAPHYGYPPDGFSPPYQYAISLGVMLYCFAGIFLLRKILLRYFSEIAAAITLLAVCLATNFIEYAAIENGQSHAFIFPLYVLVLFATIKWHERPRIGWAALTGFIIGLATISRPTEAIMLFIPLFWDTQNGEAAKQKWQLVKTHKGHIVLAALFGLLGILPQLVYWKAATGSFIFDVGSSWDFLSPHFRVLFGWEKGWFIYTPITVFFIVGMCFMKNLPFRKSVLWFCLLNIYIIISWRNWHYGGSYSTRALMQSYPVFALPFAAFVDTIRLKKWAWLFYALFAYLIGVNLFQITQYRSMIIHYDDMNRAYYGRIYLNPHPTPLDMSLLDDDEVLDNERGYAKTTLAAIDSPIPVSFTGGSQGLLYQTTIGVPENSTKDRWLKIESRLKAPNCLWQSYLDAELKKGDSIKHKRVRLFSALSINDSANDLIFYMTIPPYFTSSQFRLYISSPFTFNGVAEQVRVTKLAR